MIGALIITGLAGNTMHSPAYFGVRAANVAKPRQRGFTLIEIMVVVIIIGLLAALVVPQVLGRLDEARVTKAKSDLQGLETALTLYKLDNFVYPTTEQGLQALVSNPDPSSITHWRPDGYLPHLTKDPWGNDYQYANPGTHGLAYDLFTNGPPGSDASKIVGNWNADQ
jgi:general secretion pathway protein G